MGEDVAIVLDDNIMILLYLSNNKISFVVSFQIALKRHLQNTVAKYSFPRT